MGKTIYYTASSLDGYIADQNNSLDWLMEVGGEAGNSNFAEFFSEIGAFCMGRTTYEWCLNNDQLLENPSKWKTYYGDTPCWVFSHQKLPAIPGARIYFVSGDIKTVHEQMTQLAGGKNLWVVGGGDLAGQFADQGKLDEIILTMAPVTLGAGAPVLPRRILSSRLKLKDSKKVDQFMQLTYSLKKCA